MILDIPSPLILSSVECTIRHNLRPGNNPFQEIRGRYSVVKGLKKKIQISKF